MKVQELEVRELEVKELEVQNKNKKIRELEVKEKEIRKSNPIVILGGKVLGTRYSETSETEEIKK